VLGHEADDVKKTKTDEEEKKDETEDEMPSLEAQTEDVSNGKSEHTDDVESTNGKEATEDVIEPVRDIINICHHCIQCCSCLFVSGWTVVYRSHYNRPQFPPKVYFDGPNYRLQESHVASHVDLPSTLLLTGHAGRRLAASHDNYSTDCI